MKRKPSRSEIGRLMPSDLERIKARHRRTCDPCMRSDLEEPCDVVKLAEALERVLEAEWAVTPDWSRETWERVAEEARRVLKEVAGAE